MTYPLRYKQFHTKLISFIEKFGYFPSGHVERGVCNGVSRMGIQAFFSGDFNDFRNILIYLNKEEPDILKMEIDSARKKIKDERSLLQQEEFVLKIAAFLDGVAAFQDPQTLLEGNAFHLFESSLINQQTFPTNAVGLALQPFQLKKIGGLFEKEFLFLCFTKEETLHFFSTLTDLLKEKNINIVLRVSNVGQDESHASFFSYHQKKQAWQFFDVNSQNFLYGELPFLNNPIHLAECLLGLSTERLIAFSCSIIGQGNEVVENTELCEKLKQSPAVRETTLPVDKIDYLKSLDKDILARVIVDVNDVEYLDKLIKQEIIVNTNSLFLKAAYLGRVDIISKCLDLRFEIPANALSCIAARGDINLMKKVLTQGGKLEIDSDGGHALIHAALHKQIEMVNFLIKECSISETLCNSNGINMLHAAVYSCNPPFVRELLDSAIFLINEKTKQGFTALHFAIQFCNYEIVELLLSHKAAIEPADLYAATANGKLEILKLLCGTKDKIQDIIKSYEALSGSTLLHKASACAQDAIIAWLLKQKVDVNALDDKLFTPLHRAIGNNGTKSTIKLLLQHHATLSADFLAKQYTLLHIAAGNDRTDLMPWLLRCYPDDINKRSTDETTAIGYAISKSNIKLSLMLLEAGAHIEKNDIEAAIRTGNVELALVLIEKIHGRTQDETLFMGVFRDTLPHMTNTQIIALFDRLTDLSDPKFGFIHHQYDDFFDRLRLGIYHCKFRFSQMPWQTAPFLEAAYALGDKFIANLNNGEKIASTWEKDAKLKAFIHADLGNFFPEKSKARENKILLAIHNRLSQEHGVDVVSNIPANHKGYSALLG